MTNFLSLNSKVVLIKEKTINASFDYKNGSFIYIIASFDCKHSALCVFLSLVFLPTFVTS
jgi:hypothetical protein